MAHVMRAAAAVIILAASAVGQTTFEFHSGFWVNLHQFLMHEAVAKEPAPGDEAWRDAVDYYRREMVKRSVFDRDVKLMELRFSEAGAEPPEGLDAAHTAVLAKVAAIYRKNWWTKHDQANRKWIAAAEALLAKYGANVRKDIARAYQVDWPAKPIRTDVASYAGENGGYTTVDPSLITINSTEPSYQGMGTLEMLFHEASHTIDEKVSDALDAELKARGRLFRRRAFNHAILFYTAGETVRKYVPDYVPFGERYGIFANGWPGSLPVLEKDWKPYLDGKIGLEEAVKAVVEDYGVAR